MPNLQGQVNAQRQQQQNLQINYGLTQEQIRNGGYSPAELEALEMKRKEMEDEFFRQLVENEKYKELEETLEPAMNPIDKLLAMNRELFLMIENTVSVSMLSQLFAAQLITTSEKHMLNPDRMYYRLLRQIVIEGKEQGLFQEELTVTDITKAYAVYERAIMYDWCISSGNYSICQYSQKMLPLFLAGLLK